MASSFSLCFHVSFSLSFFHSLILFLCLFRAFASVHATFLILFLCLRSGLSDFLVSLFKYRSMSASSINVVSVRQIQFSRHFSIFHAQTLELPSWSICPTKTA